ncbi:MAG: ABC transporter substrate-binding protein, partial [Anaerolineales bacterium]
MKRRELFHVLSLLVAATMILAACAPAATEPAPTEMATEPPATEPPMAFEGMRVEAPSCDYGGILKSIEAVDPYTVVFTTCVPDPSFPAKAAFSSFQIYPSEYLESTGGAGEIVEHPIGTGPFVFEAWNRGDSIVLTRFDDYWGDPA